MKSALIVVDVQQSFQQRPYWAETDAPRFVERLQALIDRCVAQRIPVLQVFHIEEHEGAGNPFSRRSGCVKTLPGLRIEPTEVFNKSVHSAMFASNAEGQSLDYWLRKHGVGRVIVSGIRTEQCCETTTRHASDLGYQVSYVMDATLTFKMVAESGRVYTPQDIMERTELVLAGRFAEVERVATLQL
ncbi:MAG TPA: isochorismatase family protein [Steroidobacteraceae bacterium]|nr:isochorismatase family protein [Steroidobacteraceae bacterium]